MMETHGRGVWLRIVGLAFGIAALSTSGTARATEVGVGLMGAVGGNFQDKPDRTAVQPDVNPGFGGLTAGGGLMADLRFLDKGLLGLEVDVLRTTDKGTGTITFSALGASADYKLTIGQSAWHLPILAKVTIPSPIVAPMFFVGPEIVFPSDGEAKSDPAIPVTLHAKADRYVMVTAGAGVEIKVPLPILDLRIPIGLRFSYNPSLKSSFSDRTKISATGTEATYDSAWKFAVNATLGAALYF
jgi:hypothetical protein